jgi:hypothetical protein
MQGMKSGILVSFAVLRITSTMPATPLSPDWLRERRHALLAGVLLSVLYLWLLAFRGYFEISLQTYVGKGTFFKVYWAGADQEYSESRSKRVRIHGGLHHLKLFIGNLGGIHKLRLDPVEYPGEVTILRAALSQTGFQPAELGPGNFDALQPLNQVESLEVRGAGLHVITDGRDGNLEWRVTPRGTGSFPWVHPVNVLLILGGCLFLGRSASTLVERHNYVVACLLAGSVLAGVMAVVSTIHTHPDERVHLEAIKYYADHWLPPSLDSPEIAGSFSDYGKSRLSTYEIFYPLAGYFTRLLAPLKSGDLFNARAFSVLQIVGLLLLVCLRSRFRYFALPLIITPQVWYLYSYPNSDAFALTLSLVAAYQLAVPDSALNRFLSEERPRRFLISLILFGFLAGSLLLAKQNFWFFLLFLFFYLLWRFRQGYYPAPWRTWLRVAMLAGIAVSMYGARMALDYAANGPDPRAKFEQYIEQTALEQYKPSTPLEEKHPFLYLKQRGKELDVVLDLLGWGTITFATAFGSYGYTQYFGSDDYFSAVRWLVSLLLGTMVLFALIKGPPETHTLILLAAVCAGLLMGASIWNSWNENFQPQGRYMAPILPMISVVYFHLRQYVSHRLIAALALALFALGAYSFIFIGLGQIAKTSFYTAVG